MSCYNDIYTKEINNSRDNNYFSEILNKKNKKNVLSPLLYDMYGEEYAIAKKVI